MFSKRCFGICGSFFVVFGCMAAAVYGRDAFMWQGVIADESGNARESGTEVNMVFRLFTAGTDTNLWTSDSVPVTLGEGGAAKLTVTEPDNVQESYEDILKTDGDFELQTYADDIPVGPRQRILPVPFAVHSEVAAGSDGDFEVKTEACFVVRGELSANKLVCDNLHIASGDLSVNGTLNAGSISINDAGATFIGQLPVGAVLPWSGAGSLPTGWAVCDGRNGTVDLRGRFVRGMPNPKPDTLTGGEEMHALTLDEIPAHSHYVFFNEPGAKNGKPDGYKDHEEQGHWGYYYWRGGIDTVSRVSKSSGGGKPHENRPPYYAIYYIQRVR